MTNIFGNPNRIIADKGSAFTANAFKDLCSEEDIELTLCTTGVPRGNGQIERIPRIVIGSLAKLSIENSEKWFSHVQSVQKFLNSTHQRAINTTPFEVMFGVPMKRKDIDIQKVIEEEIRESFNDDRAEIRRRAKEEILKIQEENRKTYNKKRKQAQKYMANDLVAIKKTQFSTGAKLKPKNFGPYKVTKVKENHRYDIEKIGQHEGPNKTTSAADYMTPWASINMIKKASTQIMKNATVFIEGNIGAGKSTLINLLSESNFITTFQEPVGKWQNLNGSNLLNMMYDDPEKYSFAFQSYVMLTMMQQHTAKVEENKIKVMERSIFTSKNCFVQAMIENNVIESPFSDILKNWYDFCQNHFKIEPNLIIYLKTDPVKLLRRIKARGREEEQTINISYLQHLHQLHEN